MSVPDIHTEVGQWVVEYPHTSRLFEQLKIDYCCAGSRSLEVACRERHLDAESVAAQLREAKRIASSEPTDDWSQAPLPTLCDHIEQTHHLYLKSELPRLTKLIAKVNRVHGDSDPSLPVLQQVFVELRAELEPHLFKEEQVLFPAIRKLVSAAAPLHFPFGTVANPIRMMELEHDGAGNALERIRELTQDFAVPARACNTYLAMLDGLRELEADMHQHVHKENNILFPRALAAERSRAGF